MIWQAQTGSATTQYLYALVTRGCSNKDIAAKLSVGELTVRSQVSNILDKLHLASRTQAALYALQKGITSLDDIPVIEGG